MTRKILESVSSWIPSPEKPKPRRTMLQVWMDFYYFCTAHGISHAAHARTRIIRLFWIAVFVICLTIMCIQLWFIFQKFLQYPYIVQVDIRYEQAPFPAVTVCNLNPFKASMTENMEGVQQTLKVFASKITESLHKHQPWVRQKRQVQQNVTKDNEQMLHPMAKTRFYPVYSECICEINYRGERLASKSCFAADKGTIEKGFHYPKNRYRKSRCICDYDTKYNSPWPCYPSSTWQFKMCIHCDRHGHCPLRFWDPDQHVGRVFHCLCHDDFNYCVILDEGKEIASLSEELSHSGVPPHETIARPAATATATPEVLEALGFEESDGELATKAKGKENLVFAVANATEEEKVGMSYTKKEFIVMCSFGGQDCDDKDFKLHVDPVYGNCYTFNYNSSRDPPLIPARTGENYDYLPTTEAVGVRVVVHSPTVVPFPDAFGISAPLGGLTSFGLKLRKFIRLPAPYGDCLKDTRKAQLHFIYDGEYTVEGCFRSCYQNELIRRCGCGDPRFPTGSHSSPCSLTNITARHCLNNQSAMMGKFGGTLECSCNQPCKYALHCIPTICLLKDSINNNKQDSIVKRESAFSVTWSSSSWPSPTTQVADCAIGDEICVEEYRYIMSYLRIHKTDIPLCMAQPRVRGCSPQNQILILKLKVIHVCVAWIRRCKIHQPDKRRNAALIQIYYEQLNFEMMEDKPVYVFANLLSDFGGQLGLWLGLSVVSGLEFIMLIYDLCMTSYLDRKDRKASSLKPSLSFNPEGTIHKLRYTFY